MNWYLRNFAKAWLITVLIETLVIFGIFKKFLKKEPVSSKLLISSSIFANSLTLPYVWFVFPYLFLGKYSLNLTLSEIFAWLIEAIFYKVYLKLSLRNALIVSLAANFVSFCLGYLLGHVWYWV